MLKEKLNKLEKEGIRQERKIVPIEDEIQQQNFRNEDQKAMVNLIYTYYWVKDRVRAFLKPYDITMQQYNVLRILRGKYPEPMTTAEIRKRMLDKMSDSSRIVIRLDKKGLIHKKSHQTDKRLVDVIISDKGLTLLEEMDRATNHLDIIMHGLTSEEKNQFSHLCEKIRSFVCNKSD